MLLAEARLRNVEHSIDHTFHLPPFMEKIGINQLTFTFSYAGQQLPLLEGIIPYSFVFKAFEALTFYIKTCHLCTNASQ